MIAVTLDGDEIEVASFVGRRRCQHAIDRDAEPILDDSPRAHIEGAVGELGVAKTLDRHWTGLAFGAESDVAGYEVRFTRRLDGGLIVRPQQDPKPEDRYVLVVGAFDDSGGSLEIVGGISGLQAMGRPLVDPGDLGKPCWIVPQYALIPIKGVRAGQFLTEAAN